MNKIVLFFKDYLRGYSEKDIQNVKGKLKGPFKKGGITEVTKRELKAINSV